MYAMGAAARGRRIGRADPPVQSGYSHAQECCRFDDTQRSLRGVPHHRGRRSIPSRSPGSATRSRSVRRWTRRSMPPNCPPIHQTSAWTSGSDLAGRLHRPRGAAGFRTRAWAATRQRTRPIGGRSCHCSGSCSSFCSCSCFSGAAGATTAVRRESPSTAATQTVAPGVIHGRTQTEGPPLRVSGRRSLVRDCRL